ncbi:MAG: LuxR C-terminal-related transcriptional regulator [Planctomycetota bacterium]
MGPDHTTTRADACHRLAQSAAEVVSLPAVATLDWCEGAAAALTRLASPSLVAVLIATMDGRGSLRRLEAAGVSGRARAFDRAGPAIGPSATDGGLADLLPPDDPRLTALRSRLERLDVIGWDPSPGDLASPITQRLGDLPGASRWRETALGQLWTDIEPHDLFVSFQPLGREELGRGMLAYVATGGPDASPQMGDWPDGSVSIMCLEAVMPLLRDRALMAIGPRVTTANRWLTVREQLVLDQLTLGKTVRQIAEDLERSPHTVHDHVKSLHRKLNASSRGELIARALGHVSDNDESRAAQTVEHKSSPAASVPPASPSDVTIGSASHRPRLVGSPERRQD